jgi:hypothetical protein
MYSTFFQKGEKSALWLYQHQSAITPPKALQGSVDTEISALDVKEKGLGFLRKKKNQPRK